MEQKVLCDLNGVSVQGIRTPGENLKYLPLLQTCAELRNENYKTIVFTFYSTTGSFSTVLKAAQQIPDINFMIILFGFPYKKQVPRNVRICYCVIKKKKKEVNRLSLEYIYKNRPVRFFIEDELFRTNDYVSTKMSESATQIITSKVNWLEGVKYYVMKFGFNDPIFMKHYSAHFFQLIDPSRTLSISDVLVVVGTGVTTCCFFKALQNLGFTDLKFHLVQVGKPIDTDFITNNCPGIEYQTYISSSKYLEEIKLEVLDLPRQIINFGLGAEHYDGKMIEFCANIIDSIPQENSKKGLLMLSVI